jgi:hypothetical protein
MDGRIAASFPTAYGMTIAEVVFDDVVLVAIPPAGQRGVTVQEPPAALPEGAAAR